MKQNVIGITGWKNAGKTTLVEKLVTHFARAGLRVATVKHAHHEFDIDHAGTDSFRHRKAGAREVAIVSARRWALMHELDGEGEPLLSEVLARLSPCDLVLVEGYKREGHVKIEVRRGGAGVPLAPDDPSIIAIASDFVVKRGPLPVFHLDDLSGIAAFIAARFGLRL
jgi:molybdopterin-guanine dinucleotide biosynthesis adapter protein